MCGQVRKGLLNGKQLALKVPRSYRIGCYAVPARCPVLTCAIAYQVSCNSVYGFTGAGYCTPLLSYASAAY